MAFNPATATQKIAAPKEEKRPLSAEEKKRQAQEERIKLEEERIYRRGVVTIRDLIAPAAFEVKPNLVRLGDLYARTVFVVTYPRYLLIGWFTPIINFSATMDVGLFFYPVQPEIILKQLKNKVGVLEAQILGDAEKGAARDPLRETALRDIEKLRDDLTQGI